MDYFRIQSCVDKATIDDDFPPKGIVLAEAVQLSRSDPNNASKLVKAGMKRLETPIVNVKVKALRFLIHLVQNGPPAVTIELKLHTDAISRNMSWRGMPHPKKGYEPYQDLKELSQQLLDLAFNTQTSNNVSSMAISNSPISSSSVRPAGSGTMVMESAGSSGYINQRPSLEPRYLDPAADKNIINMFKKTLGIKPKEKPVTKYGTYSSDGTNLQGSNFSVTGSNYNPRTNAAQSFSNYQAPPPQRSQFQRPDNEANWSTRKPEFAPQEKQKKAETPATKILHLSGNRALPTKSELVVFKTAAKPESIIELEEALSDNDWKVKARAIYGLEALGEKFGNGAIAHVQPKLIELQSAPQASLRNSAIRLATALEGVEPTGIPEEPSAFDFSNAEEVGGEEESKEEQFVFGEEANENEEQN